MKKLLYVFVVIIFIKSIHTNLFCPKSSKPPKSIEIDESFKIIAQMSGKNYSTIIINNRVFFKDTPKITFYSSNYYDSSYCATNFLIPTKEEYESLISSLGGKAYSTLTQANGFNLTENKYFLTKNKTNSGNYNYYLMYLDGKNVKISNFTISSISIDKISINCILSFPKTTKFLYDRDFGELEYGTSTTIKTDNNYINGYLWRVSQNAFYKSSSISPKFTQSGRHRIELWAKVVNGDDIYLCDYVYVKKKKVTSTQDFSDSAIKKIETNFKMTYTNQLHFEHSNSAVSPRIDGGYYVSFSDDSKFIHVLSYDKDDNLLKDLNTNEKGYILDITTTDYGFAIYIRDAVNSNHSYLRIYNKIFELINTIEIMNNDIANKDIDSDITKQIIKYDSKGSPVFGMRFMYDPDNGKLIYSRGRIFLIFAHYNHFTDGGGHTGDTVVTFNDVLKDMDFGITWGASHSLIQSVTADDLYFWSAALSDAYPEGINVEYTSKKNFYTSSYYYDPVNKKYNSRISTENNELAGYITPYYNGLADGKLGGILYYEKLGLYAMVYAKTPVASNEENGGQNIIYVTIWKFENNQIIDKQIKIIKNFGESINVMQLRAGKYGDDKIFIIYTPTTTSGSQWYGNVPKGTIPKLFIISLPSLSFIKNDVQINSLLMNTNEDLRTFNDGVLIWATSNSNGNLVINKVGTQRLDPSYDDISYILSEKDLIEVEDEENQEEEINEEEEQNDETDKEEEINEEEEQNDETDKEEEQNDETDKEEEWHEDTDDGEEEEEEWQGKKENNGGDGSKNPLNNRTTFTILIASIIGIIILIVGLFLLCRCIRRKKFDGEVNLNEVKNEMLVK